LGQTRFNRLQQRTSIAILRPLPIPYRRCEATIALPWHASTRLRLFLGHDVSSQVYIAGCFEPNEIVFLDRILKPGMTLVDAGANDGLYTVFAASRLGSEGTARAFEPSNRELVRLKHNVR
jgi:hypothetical protein